MFIFRFIFLSFILGLCVGNAYSISTTEQIAALNKVCGGKNELLIKKLLISIVSDVNFKSDGNCNKKTSFLVKTCPNQIDCKDVYEAMQSFFDQESSNLIGE